MKTITYKKSIALVCSRCGHRDGTKWFDYNSGWGRFEPYLLCDKCVDSPERVGHTNDTIKSVKKYNMDALVASYEHQDEMEMDDREMEMEDAIKLQESFMKRMKEEGDK